MEDAKAMYTELESFGHDLENAHPIVRNVYLSLLKKLDEEGANTLIDFLVSIKQAQPFSQVLMSELAGLAEHAETVEFDAGECVFRNGEPAEAVYIVRRNKTVTHDRTNGSVEMDTILGAEALLKNAQYHEEVVLDQRSTFYRLKREIMLEYARLYPNLAVQWINAMAMN